MVCIEVPTIHSLLEDEGRDVITEFLTIAGMEDYKTDLTNAIRGMYLFRMIGSLDVDRWVLAMKERAWLTLPRYSKMADLYKDNIDTVMEDPLSTRKRTVTETVGYSREEVPETALPSDSDFLTDRGSSDRSVTETERVGLGMSLLSDNVRQVPDVFRDWAREFDDLFLRMW